MIHIGKSDGTKILKDAATQVNSAMDSGLEQFGRYEKKVGKWIEQNPLLSIGIALGIGLGMGWILKRRL